MKIMKVKLSDILDAIEMMDRYRKCTTIGLNEIRAGEKFFLHYSIYFLKLG